MSKTLIVGAWLVDTEGARALDEALDLAQEEVENLDYEVELVGWFKGNAAGPVLLGHLLADIEEALI